MEDSVDGLLGVSIKRDMVVAHGQAEETIELRQEGIDERIIIALGLYDSRRAQDTPEEYLWVRTPMDHRGMGI